MEMLDILAIALALAMDAFAVAIATGVGLKQVSFRQYFRLSWHFGLFQALMPILGWCAGSLVREWIDAYAHWVAFGLLVYVAQAMIRNALAGETEAEERKDPTRGMTLVMLSIATSIDALAIGFSLSLLNVSIWTPALIIGLVAGLFTILGMQLGRIAGSLTRLSHWAEGLGGAVLVGIGLNILHDHGVFAHLF